MNDRRWRALGIAWLLSSCLCAAPGLACAGAADLAALSGRASRILGSAQGVYVESTDGTVLVAQAADMPVHPASVSKIPTTLALLQRYGPDHRFLTTFETDGVLRDGLLDGDLIVDAGGDPFLVDENALLVAQSLRSAGLREVEGQLRVRGTLYFDWDQDSAASRLQQALTGRVPQPAWTAVRLLAPSATVSISALSFDGAPHLRAPPGTQPVQLLVRHYSQPLLMMVKCLNDYSNNIFKSFADAAGGAGGVEAYARSLLPSGEESELTLGDGAGTDPRNRMSPRVAVGLLRALERQLATTGHSLVDVLPVAGLDPGTLQRRFEAEDEAGRFVGKTGTYGDYGASALVGAFSTPDRGTVYFAILNHGVPVPEARRRQDRFVRVLLRALDARPWPYTPDPRPAVVRARVERVR